MSSLENVVVAGAFRRKHTFFSLERRNERKINHLKLFQISLDIPRRHTNDDMFILFCILFFFCFLHEEEGGGEGGRGAERRSHQCFPRDTSLSSGMLRAEVERGTSFRRQRRRRIHIYIYRYMMMMMMMIYRPYHSDGFLIVQFKQLSLQQQLEKRRSTRRSRRKRRRNRRKLRKPIRPSVNRQKTERQNNNNDTRTQDEEYY